jgi:hypothetical protein
MTGLVHWLTTLQPGILVANGLEWFGTPGHVEEWSVPYPEAVERIPLYGGGQGRCTTEKRGSDVEIFGEMVRW